MVQFLRKTSSDDLFMPRIPHRLLHRARRRSAYLPLLLRATRDLDAAQNELRWLREHVLALASSNVAHKQRTLQRACEARARGRPLQYLLSTQPFGELNVLCRPGVFIPRPETEAYTTYLAQLLLSRKEKLPTRNGKLSLRVLDLCTGTGCILLHLHQQMSGQIPDLDFLGLDISRRAVDLARRNLRKHVANETLGSAAARQVVFKRGDVLQTHAETRPQAVPGLNTILEKSTRPFDVVISNPPYISERAYDAETQRSVRNYEPKDALVPEGEDKQDIFYLAALKATSFVAAKLVLFEIGDTSQALRTLRLAARLLPSHKGEIWREWPSSNETDLDLMGSTVKIKGNGRIRALVFWMVGSGSEM